MFLALVDCSYALYAVRQHTLHSYRTTAPCMANIYPFDSGSGNILLLPSQVCVVCLSFPGWFILLLLLLLLSSFLSLSLSPFMQGIYNYIPETNHVYRICSVPAVLYLQFVLHVMLFHPWNMCTFTLAIYAISVQCPIWLFFVVP